MAIVHPQRIAVARIIGDRIEALRTHEGEKIRIADIDTPELDGACEYGRALALRARNRLIQLLNAGAFEIARTGQDRYGRTLATLHRSGRSIGVQLVAEGLARTWSGRREPWCPSG